MPYGKKKNTAGLKAFTLIELMVTLGIIAVLSTLMAAVTSEVIKRKDRTAGLHVLRNIGSAVLAYSADNAGSLPGPLWPGQIPTYDSSRPGRLVVELAPYMGIGNPPDNTVVDDFVPPAFRKQIEGRTDLAISRPFVVNHDMPLSSGQEISPWGNLAANQDARPRNLMTLPTNIWAISDADQLHPRVRNAPWRANTPEKPVHGKRNVFFLGGHTTAVDQEELLLLPGDR